MTGLRKYWAGNPEPISIKGWPKPCNGADPLKTVKPKIMKHYQSLKDNFSQSFPGIYKIVDKHKKLIKFGIVGVAATAVNWVALYFFTDILGVWYMVSAVLAFVAAFIVSFSFQKFWTFRDNCTHKLTSQAFFYFVITFSSLILNLVGLYALVDILGLYYLYSQVVLSVVLALFRYAVNNFLIFNVKNGSQDNQRSITG